MYMLEVWKYLMRVPRTKPRATIKGLLDQVKVIERYAGNYSLPEARGRAKAFYTNLRCCEKIQNELGDNEPSSIWDKNLAEFSHEIDNINEALRRELAQHKFIYISPEKRKYFKQKTAFGRDVAAAFPSAIFDIQEAGTCLSFGMNTAAVFHLMRVAEHGLRALAKKLKVKFTTLDISYATWEAVIKATELKVRELRETPGRKKKKMDELEFYQSILLEYGAMKDAIRNVVSHSRGAYDEHQATSIYIHVREFMQKLAFRMK